MDIQQLRFPKSPVNRALDDLIAWFTAITDLDGQQVFQTVQRGLYMPQSDVPPIPNTVPACLFWVDNEGLVSETTDVLFIENTVLVSAYIIWYDYGDDPKGVAAQREDMIHHIVSTLQYPEAQPPHAIWRFPVVPFTATIDHVNAYRRISEQYQLQPPWYATRIDLPIELMQASDTFRSNEE